MPQLLVLFPNRYESDLPNEALYNLAGQKAVKMFENRVGGQRKICEFSRVSNQAVSAIFFSTSNFNLKAVA